MADLPGPSCSRPFSEWERTDHINNKAFLNTPVLRNGQMVRGSLPLTLLTAVLEFDRPGLDTLVSSARWQRDKEFMGRVGGVSHHTWWLYEGSTCGVFLVLEAETPQWCCLLTSLLQHFADWYTTIAIPGNHAANQDTFNDSCVECGKDGEGESSSPQSVQELWDQQSHQTCAVLETCSLSPCPQWAVIPWVIPPS